MPFIVAVHIFDIAILILACIGHTVLWVALVNRAHALGIKRRWVHAMTLTCMAMFGIMPIVVTAAYVSALLAPNLLTTLFYGAARTYVIACAVVCIVGTVQRLYWRFHTERRGVLHSNHTTQINFAEESVEQLLTPGVISLLGRLPGNQILNISVHEKRLVIPRLRSSNALLRVAHLSDLHMSGRMLRPFYEQLVDTTNKLHADMIAITGDLVDSNDCVDWIPDVLGRLHAPAGVFFVLGNHDKRVDQSLLMAALARTSWIHLNSGMRTVQAKGIDLLLGGNERPWYGTPTDFSHAPNHSAAGLPLRIGLSHSPDQFGWACTNDLDLMLAGHVHGGQICLPVIGPITAPSMHGVRYAAGTFRHENTVLHVSRGTAAFTPLRWNCSPEIAVLTLIEPSETSLLS